MKVKNKKELFLKLDNIYQKKVIPNINQFKKKLALFLIDEIKIPYLDIFGKLIKKEIDSHI